MQESGSFWCSQQGSDLSQWWIWTKPVGIQAQLSNIWALLTTYSYEPWNFICLIRNLFTLFTLLSPPLTLQLIVPFQEDSAVVVEENTDIPDYLPEDESPSQEQDKAVTRVGSITDGMGWLSTAANFLTRSFYWWQLPMICFYLPVLSTIPSSCRLSISQPPPRLRPAAPQPYTSLDSRLQSTQSPVTRVQQELDCQVKPAIICLYLLWATHPTTGCMCTTIY